MENEIINKRNNLSIFIHIAYQTLQIDCNMPDLQEMWWALFIKYGLQWREYDGVVSIAIENMEEFFYDAINTKGITEQEFRLICLECIEPRPETASDLILKKLKSDLNPIVIHTSQAIEAKPNHITNLNALNK